MRLTRRGPFSQEEKWQSVSVETGAGSQNIVGLMRGDPEITIAGLAKSLSVTARAIKKQIEKLKA